MKEVIGLFQGFGVELEYMIVDKDTLKVKPITDEVIKHVVGKYVSDYEEEQIAWSNELVLHVIELKTNGPANSLLKLDDNFHSHVKRINQILINYNAMLLPTGAHPLFNPDTETKLWPHENNPVYQSYNRIFDCRGHGWSNLQSTHINLPFKDDIEFGKLHAAIRLLLPIIPAIAASTPILDGNYTGFIDSRLEVYRKNQIKIPAIIGKVIPEKVFTKKDYHNNILKKIYSEIAPHDTENILQNEWLNSRGAIARFERNTIEIRVVDIQECPKADLALVGLFTLLLQELVNEKHISFSDQMIFEEDELADIFLNCVRNGEHALIENAEYLEAFGLTRSLQAKDVWRYIYENITVDSNIITQDELIPVETIISNGTLATRIIKALGETPSNDQIISVYKRLGISLATNEMFLP